MRRLVCCVFVVGLTTCTAAACQGTTTESTTSTSTIPAHQCTNWNYRTGADLGKQTYASNYMVENDVWNPLQISQTLYSCNFDSFYVEANVQNRGRAVQSYPSSQYNFEGPVEVSKFTSLTSDFRVSNPPGGPGLDYEFAYDIWFNGFGGADHTEMMIWTYIDGQRPVGGELPGTIDIDGHMYEVWVYGGDGYLVIFESLNNYTAAHTNLLPFISYVSSHGWLHDGMSTPLWQIDYGAELCVTPGVTKFDFTDFTVSYKT
jgi:hypothetical protein